MVRDEYGMMASEFYHSENVEQTIKYAKDRYDLGYMEWERKRIIPGIRKTQETIAGLKERIAELQAQVGDKEKAITMALQLDEVWYNRARQLEDPAMYYNYVVVEYWTKETERSNEKGRKLKSEMTPMATIRVMRMPKDRIVKQNTEADKAEDQKNGYVVQDFSYPKVKEGEAPKLSFVEMHTTPDAPDMMPFLNEEGMKLFAGIAYFCNAHGNARYEKSAEIANPTPAVVAAKIAETLKANKDAELVCLDERKVAKRYL